MDEQGLYGNAFLRDQLTGASDALGRPAQGSDPRLGYNMTNGSDPEARTGVLPFLGAPGAEVRWDGATILRNWSQGDSRDAGTTTSDERCAAHAAMAPAILAGPSAMCAFVSRLLGQLDVRKSAGNLTAEQALALARHVATLMSFSFRVGGRLATYEDLSGIAEALYLVLDRDKNNAGTSLRDFASMMAVSGRATTMLRPVPSKAAMEGHIDDLGDQQAYSVGVATGAATNAPRDHAVTMGVLGEATYLYDPAPRRGAQLVTDDQSSFWTLFETAAGEWKNQTVLVSRLHAAATK
jgi:hypothetical protein